MEELLSDWAHSPIALIATLGAVLLSFGLVRWRQTVDERKARLEKQTAARRQRAKACGSPMEPLTTTGRVDKIERIRPPQPLLADLSEDLGLDGGKLDTGQITALWLSDPEEGEDDGDGPTPIDPPDDDPGAEIDALLEHIGSQDEMIARLEQRRESDAGYARELERRLAVAHVDEMLVALQDHGRPMTAQELADAAGCDLESAEFSRRTMAALVFGLLRVSHDSEGEHRLETARYYLAGQIPVDVERQELETVRLSRVERRELAEALAPEMFITATDHHPESWDREIGEAMHRRSVNQ